MPAKKSRVFLDTSAIFAAVLSASGGARKLFLLGEAEVLQLVVGPAVLRECDAVMQRKAPAWRPWLAQMLAAAATETCPAASQQHLSKAHSLVGYAPDAQVLAEALGAHPDWFVTHDKQHFLKAQSGSSLPFEVGTPGDLLQRFKDQYTWL